MEQENEVVDSAEITTEDLGDNDSQDESTGEDEVAKTTESSKQQSGETPDQLRARLTRQKERAEKKLAELDGKTYSKGKEGSEESSKVDADERYSRLELKTEGVTSKKAQDIVLDYAKYKGIEPLDALKSPIVRAEMAELEKKTSVPAPSSRTNAGPSNDFAYWVGQAKKGNFPRHDRAMMEKLAKARIW
jgi:hypothetical protein